MGFMRVSQDAGGVTRLVPGPEYKAAPGMALLLSSVCLAGAGLVMGEDALGGVFLFVASLMLLLVVGLLRARMRDVVFDTAEGAVYLLGRRRSDVAQVPLCEVVALRTMRTGRGGRYRELVLALRDGGWISLDRGSRHEPLTRLGALLAARTGLAFEDDAASPASSSAAIHVPPHVTDHVTPGTSDVSIATDVAHASRHDSVAGVEASGDVSVVACADVPGEPSPGSALVQDARGRSWQWPVSPGGAALGLMAFVSGAFLCVVGYGLSLMLGGGYVEGLVMAFVGGFFTYVVMGRLLRGIFGGGWLTVRGRLLQAGGSLFDRRHTLWECALDDVAGFRVTASMLGPARLECVTTRGEVLPVIAVTPGLSAVTPGDVLWLAARLRMLASRRTL